VLILRNRFGSCAKFLFSDIFHKTNILNIYKKCGAHIRFHSTTNLITVPSYNISDSFDNQVLAIMSDLRKSRMKIDSILEQDLKEGIEHFENFHTKQALSCFTRIISLISGDDADDLCTKERRLIGLAFTNKAKILRVGTEKDESLALAHLEQALKISPNLKEAEDLLSSLLAERAVPKLIK